jgi:hypothetical protein
LDEFNPKPPLPSAPEKTVRMPPRKELSSSTYVILLGVLIVGRLSLFPEPYGNFKPFPYLPISKVRPVETAVNSPRLAAFLQLLGVASLPLKANISPFARGLLQSIGVPGCG